MAFTTEYSITQIVPKTQVPTYQKGNDPPATGTNNDTISLSGGGWATSVSDSTGYSDVSFYTTDGTVIQTAQNFDYLNAQLAQLVNGNVVGVGNKNGVVAAYIYSARGEQVNETPFATNSAYSESNADVASLNNGNFVIVDQRYNSSRDEGNIEVYIRNASGGAVKAFTVDTSRADDNHAKVIGLKDGGFAVAWDRTDPREGGVSIWFAIYNADGSVRNGPTLLDDNGRTLRNPSISALANGGFAVSYEDNGYDNHQSDITVAMVTANGIITGANAASYLTTPDTEASVATLSNGLVLTTFTNANGSDHDILATLLDPSGDGAALTSPGAPLQIDSSVDDTTTSSVAALALGQFAVSYTNVTDSAPNVATFQLVRTATGTNGGDTFEGDDAVNKVFGLGGNDTIKGGANGDTLNGGAGNDTIYGNGGNDVLIGGIGNDYLNGGGGNDTASYAGLTGNVTADLRITSEQDTGAGGSDTLVSIENLLGGNGSDTLIGSSIANRITGGKGNDTITGLGGADILTGGLGADTYVYKSLSDSGLTSATRDRITDFDTGVDKIDLSAIDANTKRSDDQAFTFIGEHVFTGFAGQLNVSHVGSSTFVQGDVNGDTVADFQIQLTGNFRLQATDFVL